MDLPDADTILVRYGDIGHKGPSVQQRMADRLCSNIQTTLERRDLRAKVSPQHTRLYLSADPSVIDDICTAVTDVFGVVSASPTITCDPTLENICTVLETAAFNHPGGSFAVRARRAGPAEAHSFTSEDIQRRGGTTIESMLERNGMEPTVDLERPDQTYYVECRENRADIFVEKRSGPGGLPVGTQAPLVALISGGIDSPVAAWLAMKRGCPIYPLYIDLGAYGGPDHQARAIETTTRVQQYAGPDPAPLAIAPAGAYTGHIVETIDRYRMLILRRLFVLIAEEYARNRGATGIVTGEAIGQKSSQTSTNLGVTSSAVSLPVHRPVLTMDKPEITNLAREIGTFEDSTIDTGCYRLAPDNPATAPALLAVEEVQPNDIEQRAQAIAQDITIPPEDETSPGNPSSRS